MPGLLAALFSAALWVFAATWKQLPVSTTHSIIGALVGFGALAGGPGAVRWGKLIPIVLSWLVSPIFAALLAYAVFGFIHRKILSKPQLFWTALRWTPA